MWRHKELLFYVTHARCFSAALPMTAEAAKRLICFEAVITMARNSSTNF